MQCRCSVGSERAPASHAWLARARAPLHRKERTSPSFSLSVSPLLCIHTSLSPPSFSLYPYLLSISLTCIYIYPLLRGSFSQRINLYVYNLTTVYFPRSFFQRVWLLSAHSQASPRTRRTRKLSISSLTPCSWNPFLPPDFSDYVDFQSEIHMYIFQRNCEKSVIERMEESNPGVFPRRSSIGRCTRPLDKLCSAHRLLIDCLHLVSLHWRPFVEIGSEKGGGSKKTRGGRSFLTRPVSSIFAAFLSENRPLLRFQSSNFYMYFISLRFRWVRQEYSKDRRF